MSESRQTSPHDVIQCGHMQSFGRKKRGHRHKWEGNTGRGNPASKTEDTVLGEDLKMLPRGSRHSFLSGNLGKLSFLQCEGNLMLVCWSVQQEKEHSL